MAVLSAWSTHLIQTNQQVNNALRDGDDKGRGREAFEKVLFFCLRGKGRGGRDLILPGDIPGMFFHT